jgi:type III secretion system low calcium response chaperone LcrH/SycD
MTTANSSFSEDALSELIAAYTKEGKPLPHFSEDTVEALYSFGYGFYQHAKFDKAIHFFRFLTLIDTQNPKHWMGLGASLQMVKDYHKAIQCFGYAALLNPSNPYPPFHAAECFLSLEENEKAIEVFKAAELAANQSPNQYQTLLTRIALMHPGRKTHGN